MTSSPCDVDGGKEGGPGGGTDRGRDKAAGACPVDMMALTVVVYCGVTLTQWASKTKSPPCSYMVWFSQVQDNLDLDIGHEDMMPKVVVFDIQYNEIE